MLVAASRQRGGGNILVAGIGGDCLDSFFAAVKVAVVTLTLDPPNTQYSMALTF